MKTSPLFLAVMLMTATALRAQIVNDGATNTLSNVTNTFTGDVTVGTNGSFTLLVLSDNALLTNTASGYIGRNASAKSNEVQLISSSARWFPGANLFVGNDGAFNRLVVSNGATVRAGSSFLGFSSASASNNQALVTGSGSVWDAGGFYLGFLGAGNQLVVSNGGVLQTAFGYTGAGTTSTNNLSVVTGSGSTWTSTTDLGVGLGGVGNQLVVSNGGAVRNGHGYVGVNASASNNLALITGAGSVWSNALDLEVGSFVANKNQMIVSNGATVFAAGNGLIGTTTNANRNSVTVTDPGTRWWVGTSLYVGSNGAFSSLVVSNGALVENNNGILGSRLDSSNNVALVSGGGSVWTNRNNLDIGGFGRGNQMVVSNGGWVASKNVRVGVDASSSNNLVLVSGSGSVWSNAFGLSVGNIAPGNRLVIEAGGLVHDDTGVVGDFNSASNNEALVTGPGSVWTNRSFLTIGSQIGRNRLVVSNGASVWSGTGSVGGTSAVSNQVVVTGADSVWSNQTLLILGGNSVGNRADVSDGGWLACSDGYVGSGFSANSNTVVLTGGASGWNNLAGLIVGDGGSGNVLIASNGATVLSSNATIGASTSLGNNNLALMTGAGTMWSNRNDFIVGNHSVGNRLVVSNGASVFINGNNDFPGDNNVVLGVNSGANSNSVTLVDLNTRLIGSFLADFTVGSNGSFNQLVISNGAVANCRAGYLGRGGGGTNSVVVTGPGSVWTVDTSILIGHSLNGSSSGNRLTIANGAVLSGYVGNLAGFNCEASVTGTGSVWSNQSNLYVDGSGNRLVVSNGGVFLAAGHVLVGEFTSSTNNRVVVDNGTLRVTNAAGAGVLDVCRGTNVLNAGLIDADQLVLARPQGLFEFNGGTLITRGAFISNNVPFTLGRSGTTPAVWDVRAGSTNYLLAGRLIVGTNSSFNQVFITNGAVLDGKDYTFLAFNSGSNNAVTVSGPGSTLNSSFGFFVGADGDANRMLISNGGKVFANLGNSGTFIGRSVGTKSNAVAVADPGSRWSVNDFLFVGSGGNASQLVVSNGATVDSLIGYVGSVGSNNLAIVTGANSSWSNRSELYVGSIAGGNRLVVTDGATVINSNAIVGQTSGSRSNTVLVTGAGSFWNNRADLQVGYGGRDNRLLVSNGGTVTSDNAFLGFASPGTHNTAVVSDPGSVWSNRLDLRIGHESTFGLLVVSNQAQVLDRFGMIGSGTVSGDNGAVVTGVGSLWSNAVDLIVGNGTIVGSDNWLLVTNGGAAVAAGNGIIGGTTGSLFNQATVADPLSRWEVSGDLYVGSLGAASLLSVTNAGTVVNSNGYVGFDVASDSNLALITGGGSTWSNRETLVVGQSSKGNRLEVSAGALVVDRNGEIGSSGSASNNVVEVSGPGTVWSNAATLLLGRSGSGNQLVISNGAVVWSSEASLAVSSVSRSNVAVVTGPGSVWNASISLGTDGSSNRLVVSDGGVVRGVTTQIGANPSSAFNLAVISGSGSVWTNSSELSVGTQGSGNQLVVSNSGLAIARNFIFLGPNPTASSNRIEINGGSLVVSNSGGGGTLDLRRGTAVLNAGFIVADRLLVTNGAGFLQFNGGTLSVANSRVSNGTLFRVGDGVNPATLLLAGNGLHEFTSVLAVTVSSNATLTGNGTIGGAVPLLLSVGSLLSPGASVGKMIFSNSPSLRGTVVTEISKNGATLTNDQIQVIAPLTYGGSLVVSNLGPTALAVGDRFPLFNANSYTGGFTNIVLPPLTPGLGWTNKLLVDGSIEVIEGPKFTSITLSGANVIIAGTNGPPNASYVMLTATNVAAPLSNWLSLVTNQFGPGGEFAVTNALAPGEPQRYFRIRTP